jgi:nitroimidazol reductase NimA-like FMN-containing flavoprotein (pyridoxamine 5'-phosphate oxidase superfamily)
MAVHSMRKAEREITDSSEIRAILSHGKFATIACVGAGRRTP